VIIGIVVLSLVSVAMTVISGTTLWWMLHAWSSASSLAATSFDVDPSPPLRSFSLLVPARHEQAVLAETLDRLAALEHPRFEVIAIVGHDDPETEAIARAAAERHPDIVRVVVDVSVPKSKPKAMNTALQHCHGDMIGVFDAEDEVHPKLLQYVDSTFGSSGADVVQGGVQLMNFRSNWWAVRNCLEYWFWFRSRMHFHAGARFIPLGGNTVFVRAALLRSSGGWEDHCLAEDCELGVRLSTAGAKVVVCYDPEIVTREETPGSLWSWFKQRCRWDQGFLQVYAKREWRSLPTLRQRTLARYTLAMPFLQAFTGVMIPVSIILMVVASVPVPIALLSLAPLVPTILVLMVEIAGVGDFANAYGSKARLLEYLRLIVGAVPYQLLLALAAMRAVVRHWRGEVSWEKTAHSGVHRVPVVQPIGVSR